MSAMSDNDRIEPTLNPVYQAPADAGPEEREALQAVQAANEADLLSQVQAELAALQAKNAELAEQFLRAQADMQNTRRRAEDEMSKARKFAVESFAESLLAVADSLEAGLAIKDATPGTDPRRRRSHAAPAQERAGAQQGDRDQPQPGRQVRPAPAPGHLGGAGAHRIHTGSQHRGRACCKRAT